MDIKPGHRTTEMWIAAINSVVILGITLGLITADVGDAIEGIAVAVTPLALAYISGRYSDSRARVKAGG